MTVDEDGFIALDEDADPRQGARNVVSFAQASGEALGSAYKRLVRRRV